MKQTVCALAAALVVAAPATGHAATPDDPLEGFNRGLYAIHRGLDRFVFRPAAMAYVTVLPQPIRKGLRNFINNLKEPGIAFNDLIQAHPTRAAKTSARFIINSTAGIGGLMDIAHDAGLPYHENGFGTTAGRWGITPGPYLFIPFIGPTDFRDLLGTLGDIATDPLGWKPFENGQVIYSRAIIDGLDQRATADQQLQAIDNMSTDPYASLRSLYEQNRTVQIQEAVVGQSGVVAPTLDDLQDPGATQSPAPVGPNAPATGPASTLQPGAAIDQSIRDMMARPLRLVSGSTLEPLRAG